MPIYEYACRDCEHRFETIQKAAEGPLQECPACGQPALKKLLSAPVFRLKGSGWYETDFKTGDKRNVAESAEAKSEDSAASNGGGEAKADATGEKTPAKGADGAAPAKPEGKKEAGGGAKPAGTTAAKAAADRKPKERS